MQTRLQSRDRARTEASIITAACDLLAEVGFHRFGINAVAKRASCDKQLIYRYFGGIDGLMDAVGIALADKMGQALSDDGACPATTYTELAERYILGFLDLLRSNILLQRIVVWEIADASPMVARLSSARGQAMARWLERVRGSITTPAHIDAAAVNMLLIGAAQQAVLAGQTAGRFSGMRLCDDNDWLRVRNGLRTVIRTVYAGM